MKWCHSATLAHAVKDDHGVGGVGSYTTWYGEPLTVHDAMPRDGKIYDDGDPIVERVKQLITEQRAKDELVRRRMLSQ